MLYPNRHSYLLYGGIGLAMLVLSVFAILCSSLPADAGSLPPTQNVFIYGEPPDQAIVNQPYLFEAQVSGPPTSEYFYTITNKPSWASFDVNSGILSGTPTAANIGTTSDIVINVTDGTQTATLPPFNLTVVANEAAIDDSPIFGFPQAPPVVNVGELYYWDPGVYDPENENLIFSASNLPAWLKIDPVTGIISGTPAAGDVGTVIGVIIIATEESSVTSSDTNVTLDSVVNSTSQTVNIAVNNPNLPFSPSSLSFCAPQGAAFPTQTILIPGTSVAEDDEIYGSTTQDFSASVNNDYNGSSSSIKVAPLGPGLSAGLNSKKVTFKLRGTTYTVPVAIVVGTNCTTGAVQPAPTPAPTTTPNSPVPPTPVGALQVSRTQLEFAGVVGQSIAAQSLNLNSTGAALNWTATRDHSSWLSLSSYGGTTPQIVNVSINAAALSAGEQTSKISFRDSNNAGVDVTVILRLSPAPAQGNPPSGDVQVTAIEVTQGIQNLLNQMDLVSKRLTFVRAHVKSTTGSDISNVSSKLVVRRDNNVLGTLAPINEGKSITVKSSPDRKTLDDAFLFELDPSWLNGTLTLEFGSDSRTIGCADINNTPNDCKATVTFTDLPAMPIQFFKGTGSKGEATDEMVERARKLLMDFMPIGQMAEQAPPISFAGSTSHRTYLSEIDAKRGSAKVQYYGIVPGAGGGIANCAGFSSTHDNYSTGLQYVGVHEFEHNSGLNHFDANESGCPIAYNDLPQYVREGRISEATDGPNAYFGIRRYKEDDKDFRPLGGPLVPGTMRIDIYGATTSSDALFRGYQGLPKFISAYAYKLMLDQTKTKYQPGAQTAETTAIVTGTLISGQITSTTAGSIDSITQLTLPGAVTQPAMGEYNIRLEGANGATLTVLPAVLQPYEEAMSEQSSTGEITSFTSLTGQPLTPDVKLIQLRHGESVLATVNAPTSGAPQISNLSIVQGDTGLDLAVTVASSAKVSYRLEVSVDGGTTWMQVAADGPLTVGALDGVVDANLVPGSGAQQWRLLVSDGFYTSIAQLSTELTIENKAPIAYITSESTEPNAMGGQNIYLSGYGQDLEDGILSGEQLIWHSDRDGVLGTGTSLVIPADRLSEGRHVFSLEAIDSQEQSSIFSRSHGVTSAATVRPAAVQATLGSSTSSFAELEILRSAPYQKSQLELLDLWVGVETGETASTSFAINHSGDGGAVGWSIVSASLPTWMTVSKSSGQTPDSTLITVDAGALAEGEYTGAITIQSTFAGQTTTEYVPYTVVVGAPSVKTVYLPMVSR